MQPGEWLLTNGLGGYALGPGGGPPARGYHGWLVAAVRPPDERVLLVGAIETVLVIDGVETRLAELELRAGRAERHGAEVRLAATMPPGVNGVVLRWTREDQGWQDVLLRLGPLLAGRDHHPSPSGGPCPSSVRIAPDGRTARIDWAAPGIPALAVATHRAHIAATHREVAVHYTEEEARGTPADETLHVELAITARLEHGSPVTLVLATEAGATAGTPTPEDAAAAIAASEQRAEALVTLAGLRGSPALEALVLAADRFLVRRPDPSLPHPGDGVTVIAGYPWFGDWGRDTMISLPGLTLATNRHAEAARILRTWAGLVRDGLLPNHFPEQGGGSPAYHAIDAPLWFVHALGAYVDATGDEALALSLRPAVEQILDAFQRGTRFGIGMDQADGLVRGGEPGLQLTWMDAKVDGAVMTPRHGKPVEIQALWIEALRLAGRWAAAAGEVGLAAARNDVAALATASFRARFFRADLGWLHDVVDGPEGDDPSLRPNQLLAVSLVPDLVDAAQAASVLEAVGRHLVVPGGVRTLAPFEPAYRPSFQGPPAFRDSAYHQGPAWTWLLGPWISAVARVQGIEAGRRELDRALAALDPDSTGAIPELLEPEPPHEARGCPWQAWGVAELLRAATALRP